MSTHEASGYVRGISATIVASGQTSCVQNVQTRIAEATHQGKLRN